jgi:hypothetical protein
MPASRPIEERFAEKYRVNPKTGCWDWVGCTSRGYGYIGLGVALGGGLILAHRFSYEHHIGPIPDGKIVRHCCDNPLCMNPAHLLLGVHGDNMQDMKRTGRSRVLSSVEVAKAKKMFDAGVSHELVGVVLGVARSTVDRAVLKAKSGDMGPRTVVAKSRGYQRMTEKQRNHAKALMKAGEPILRIAALFGVDRKTIRNLRKS